MTAYHRCIGGTHNYYTLFPLGPFSTKVRQNNKGGPPQLNETTSAKEAFWARFPKTLHVQHSRYGTKGMMKSYKKKGRNGTEDKKK